MFFITPQNRDAYHSSGEVIPPTHDEPANKRKRGTLAQDVASYYPKRVPKACDRCRMKKLRCSGGQLCAQCRQDGVVCVNTQPSKKGMIQNNPAYVQLVESQRDQLVQVLRQVLQSKDAAAASSQLRSTLAGMGIDTASLLPSESDTTPTSTQHSHHPRSQTLNHGIRFLAA
jgi:Fungal Zn(2)-Cys(6) binuclear cluster domain